MMALLWIYDLLFPLALLLAAPWWLMRMLTTQRYREGLLERLGLVPARFRAGVEQRSTLWVHAVSVGETLAAIQLIRQLEAERPAMRIVLSTTTRTGQQLARQRLGVDRVFYCPLDVAWATHAWLEALQPRMLVLMETEFWPGLLRRCFRRKIPVVVVNARISDRSWPRYRRLRRLWKPLLERLQAVLAQSELDAKRLEELGCRQVVAAGNLKYDIQIEKHSALTLQLQTLAAGKRWVVAGSTLEGEEAMLLTAWKQQIAVHADLVLLLAPRHPERFAAVADLLKASGLRWRRRSTLGSEALHAGEVILLDSIGELASAYSLATVAFVGGSLVAAGGHNPLEAAWHGVPVMMGSHTENFRAIVHELQNQQAICILHSNNVEALGVTLQTMLNDAIATLAMGARARQVLERHSGTTAKCVATLCALLHDPPQEEA